MSELLKHEKWIVSTKLSKHKVTNQVWDSSKPLGLGAPYRWILEKTPHGIRSVETRLGKGRSIAPKLLKYEEIEKGKTFDYGDTEIIVRKIHKVSPAFVSAHLKEVKQGETQWLFVYHGLHGILTSADRVVKKYYAKLKDEVVFELKESQESFEITPRKEGFRIESIQAEPLTKDTTLTIEKAKLSTLLVLFGKYWWRFQFVLEPSALVSESATGPSFKDFSKDETAYFKKATKVIIGILLLLLLVTFLYPEKKPEEVVEQRIVKVVKPRIEGKLSGAGLSGSPAPLTVAETTPTQPGAAPTNNQAKAQMLKDIFGAATALARKSTSTTTVASRTGESQNQAQNVNLGSTDVKPVGSSPLSKVGSMGSGGSGKSGVGYGSGEKGNVVGGTSGLASIDNLGAMVEEGLTKEEVGAVIHSHMSEVRYCHESSLLVNPKSEGKLVLKFRINPKGDVEVVDIQSTDLPEKGLEGCIMKRLKTWKFPKPKGGVFVTVAYPFLFKTLSRE